jgi:hypothetical protein
MRAARGGNAHGAAETTGTYLAGVGTSGALLAGAAIVFVTLVGLASFDVWPGERGGSSSGVVDLVPAKPEVEEPAAPPSPASSSSPSSATSGAASGSASAPTGEGKSNKRQQYVDSTARAGVARAPQEVITQPGPGDGSRSGSGGNSGGGSNSGGGGNAGKSPGHGGKAQGQSRSVSTQQKPQRDAGNGSGGQGPKQSPGRSSPGNTGGGSPKGK